MIECLQDKSKEGMQSNLLDPPGYRKLLSRKSEPIFPRELQFQRTIITWHIVTDLFYYFDDKSSTASDTRRRNCKRVVGLYVLPLGKATSHVASRSRAINSS
ncbi:hypothetical protein AAZX31_02G128600 [Glycine max]